MRRIFALLLILVVMAFAAGESHAICALIKNHNCGYVVCAPRYIRHCWTNHPRLPPHGGGHGGYGWGHRR